jgi:hypothetical protein
LNPDLLQETEKLVRSWSHHESAWLRDYLVAEVEDPRLNLQSIISRHFLIRRLTGERFSDLMSQEYRFAAVMDWLRRVAKLENDPDGRIVTLYALRQGADNAEGLEIPTFVLQTFTSLPAETCGCAIPNYVEAFLSREESGNLQSSVVDPLLDTFAIAWSQLLGERSHATDSELVAPSIGSGECSPVSRPLLSLLEPACGSANDYRFLDRYGIARFLQYHGFDLCEKNIINAQALYPSIRFELGNVFEIAAADKSYDVCIVQDLFEHLSISGMEKAVDEICRVTRAGICAGFFQMDEISNHVVRPVEQYHWNLLSQARIKEFFAGNGFAAQVLHIGTFLHRQLGCPHTHNPNAYTFVLTRT